MRLFRVSSFLAEKIQPILTAVKPEKSNRIEEHRAAKSPGNEIKQAQKSLNIYPK